MRPAGRGRIDVYELGDATIGRMTYEPGWHWYDDLRPIVGGEQCQVRHVGVVISGHLHIAMEDGSSIDLLPGDVYEIPAGHDGRVIGDEAFVAIDSAVVRR